jgi:hypothetical protein
MAQHDIRKQLSDPETRSFHRARRDQIFEVNQARRNGIYI